MSHKRKTTLTTIVIAILFSVLFFRPHVSALDDASSLQCSGGIVMAGDSEDSVREKCGDPQKVTREDADSPTVWFYNFGPSEFVCYLSFTNGVVERIQMGGYGD